MSHLAGYEPRPISITGGEGCYLFDDRGRKYLDFNAGWCVGNIGWKNQAVEQAIKRQAERGFFVAQLFQSREQEQFAELLTSIAPNKKLTKVFRCTSGSEAVEFAIKSARAATGKPVIISIDGVYHGHTYGAASVGRSCKRAMAPCLPGFEKIPMPHPHYGLTGEEVLRQFETLLKSRSDIAAFLTEPLFTNAGAIVPPQDFFPRIQALCRQHGALFIMDEVATGFGRTGKLFGSELWGLEPDIICLGKGLTGGYGTMGATLVTNAVAGRAKGFPMFSTFGWALTDVAAARANIEFILEHKLWENSARVGKWLLDQCRVFEKLPYVAEVRGRGLVIGIEIVGKWLGTRAYLRAEQLQDACAEQGLLIETADNALFITPPLILTQEQAEVGFAILKKVLR